jgi:capsule polysaccharide export protein KpsC/LpsZ
MKNVSINDNGDISIHYDNLNPSEVENLISTLQGHLWNMKQKKESPIDVMVKSVRRSRNGDISFKLSWACEEIIFNQDDALPQPNILLTPEQEESYYNMLNKMVA